MAPKLFNRNKKQEVTDSIVTEEVKLDSSDDPLNPETSVKLANKEFVKTEFVDYDMSSILVSYQNKILALLKSYTDNETVIDSLVIENSIRKVLLLQNKFQWVVNPTLDASEYQSIIKRLTNRQFLIFRHLSYSFDYLDARSQKEFEEWERKFLEKKILFEICFKKFTPIIGNLVNWNNVNDLSETHLFMGMNPSEAIINAIRKYFELNEDVLAEKFHNLLKWYEWAHDLNYGKKLEVITHNWKQYLKTWMKVFSEVFAWTHKTEWQFLRFNEFAELIHKYRVKSVNFKVDKKIDVLELR